MKPHVNIERLLGELNALAKISSYPAPAVTRIVFSEEDRRGRAMLRALYEAAGLSVHVDPIGNTFARWTGTEPSLPGIGSGSHTDAIPNAGMYDGTVGVLGALEAIRALQAAGFKPRRSIDVIMFTSEEPTRFAMGCTGSRTMSGVLSPAQLSALTDSEGHHYDQVRTAAGFRGDMSKVRLSADHYHAFVELHIEQGPRLEAANLDIGIVTAIAAPATLDVVVDGEGGHAGGVMMRDRHDAFCAAAEIVLMLERLANAASPDTVGTCGQIRVEPAAVNSIPFRAAMTFDIRDIDGERRDRLIEDLVAGSYVLASRRGVKVRFTTRNADPPAACADFVIDAVQAACEGAGASSMKLVSRAYHDSLFMARLCPIGMIFIPCRGGVSHRPDEYASPEHIARGVEVLARTLATLAG